MLQAINGKIPDEEYNHNPDVVNNEGKTVCYYLWINKYKIPT